MSDDVALPLQFTDAAANKVKSLIADEDNPNLKLRVYITGGGCSGFQYGFTFDDQVNEGDMTIEKQGVGLVVDPMSFAVSGGWFGRLYRRSGRFPLHCNQPECEKYLRVWLFLQHLIAVRCAGWRRERLIRPTGKMFQAR